MTGRSFRDGNRLCKILIVTLMISNALVEEDNRECTAITVVTYEKVIMEKIYIAE